MSRRLYENLAVGRLERLNVEIATDLRNEFLNFSNYWYFDELANKDEEIEHFQLQCRAYRVEELRGQIEQELANMNAALNEYNQQRSTEAVNRLAMLSMLFGAGAVLTGFFGMNFGHVFEKYLFKPDFATLPVHIAAVAVVTLITVSIMSLGGILWLRTGATTGLFCAHVAPPPSVTAGSACASAGNRSGYSRPNFGSCRVPVILTLV